MKIEYTLEELLAMESSENKKRIQEKSERLKEDYLLTQIRNDLNMSQTELAKALGGQLSLQIRMPTSDLRSYFV